MALDRIDGEIVAALQNDSRLSNKELAARVGLAPSTCLERVRRLRASGVLRGFHADVDPKALGIGLQAFVAIRLGRHSREVYETFQTHVLSLDEVVATYHVAGSNDFMLHVVVRDPQHLQVLILDAFTTWDEVVHVETTLIYGHKRRAALPRYA